MREIEDYPFSKTTKYIVNTIIILIAFSFWWVLVSSIYEDLFAFELESNRANYINYAQHEGSEYLNFQMSVKKELINHFSVSYTQRSFWDIYEPSAPFREHNHNPEIYFNSKYFDVGYEHESNGMDKTASRSWDRFYFKAKYSKDFYYVSLKPWHSFFLHENKDLDKLWGTWESETGLVWNDKIDIRMTNRVKSTKIEVFYNAGEFYLYAQSFNGFGGFGMIDFDKAHYINSFGIAFSK